MPSGGDELRTEHLERYHRAHLGVKVTVVRVRAGFGLGVRVRFRMKVSLPGSSAPSPSRPRSPVGNICSMLGTSY